MKTLTIDAFTKALTAAGAQHGASGVAHAKALILRDAMIVDADGMPIDPASIDITISPAAPAESDDAAEAADDTTTDMAPEDATDVAKAVRHEIRIAARKSADSIAVTRGVVTAGDAYPTFRSRAKSFKDPRDAYRFGRFIMAAAGNAKSVDWCARNGINLKAHSEGVNSAGGFLVPDEFEATLIDLREQHGVFRSNARVYAMSRDTLNIPKRTGNLTSYWVGETAPGTESTQTFDNVGLVAKKLFAITTASNELVEDAVVNVGDEVARDIAWEFSKREDEAGFNGNGTSQYGGIVGLASSMGSAGQTDTGLNTGDLSSVTLAMVHDWMAKLPAYANTPNTKIYCHKAIFHYVFERLAMAAGGTSAEQIANGIAPRFFGYPVVYTQAMPSGTASGTAGDAIAYFGDLSLAAAFGDRRATSIRTSDSALNAFEQDEIVIRGTQRVDIVCHSVGDTTDAGAIVQLFR